MAADESGVRLGQLGRGPTEPLWSGSALTQGGESATLAQPAHRLNQSCTAEAHAEPPQCPSAVCCGPPHGSNQPLGSGK
eukprot:14073399-Alexandrium_andersonii.AAC.1